MADVSSVDIVAFYTQYITLHGKPTRNWSSGETEYHGNCPWCGGEDRFMFCLPNGRFSCGIRASGCGRHGRDLLDFLQQKEGLSMETACDRLGLSLEARHAPAAHITPAFSHDVQPPPQAWQERAGAIIHTAEQVLWSSHGNAALAYLHQRGFSDETIRAARLGYIPRKQDGTWYSMTTHDVGLSSEEDQERIWLPEGICIPWYGEDQLWKINVRRLEKLKAGEPRYIQIKGSAEGLYNYAAVRDDLPAVLCESEFDALSGIQECGELATFVATGSASRARREQWCRLLNQSPHVLIAFDNDAPDASGKQAGDQGAAYWEKMLLHTLRWRPLSKDVNDMLTAGYNLAVWVRRGNQLYEQEHAVPAQTLLPLVSSQAITYSIEQTASTTLVVHEQALPFEPDPVILTAKEIEQWIRDVWRDMQHEAYPYEPYDLPPLDRATCPFRVITYGRIQQQRHANRPRFVPCRRPATHNGWCKEHAHAHILLTLGSYLRYPDMEFDKCTGVMMGVSAWEEAASRSPRPRVVRALESVGSRLNPDLYSELKIGLQALG